MTNIALKIVDINPENTMFLQEILTSKTNNLILLIIQYHNNYSKQEV